MKVQKTQTDILIISVLLLLFSIFLLLKIHGYFDYTANYDIEVISCSEQNNSVMMIDCDLKTTWGIQEKNHCCEEQINIRFRECRQIGGINIVNVTQEPTRDINIYVSKDSKEWEPVEYVLEQSNDVTWKYAFRDVVFAKVLKLEYCDKEVGTWPITEVYIYE